MKVRDYVNDMILGQKWYVEVNFYDKHNEWVSVDTFEYSIPHTKCKWLDNDVKYFRTCRDAILLVVDD